MDAKKLREIEGLYKDLKERHDAGEVSAEEMKAELKKMMVRDDEGRFWMLGGKTGGWYVYDGSAWNAADPYAGGEGESEAPVEAIAAAASPAAASIQAAAGGGEAAKPTPAASVKRIKEEEQKAETLCKFCHSRLDEHDPYCKFCGAGTKAIAKPPARRLAEDEIQVKSVRLFSLVVFLGGLGLVVGVVLGASFGIFKILGDLIYQFPVMLQEMRGKLLGGLFFGAIGGIAGFALFAALGLLLGLFFNALCFVFTGPRFKIKS